MDQSLVSDGPLISSRGASASRRAINSLFTAFLFMSPVTSFLVLPMVQGLTPAVALLMATLTVVAIDSLRRRVIPRTALQVLACLTILLIHLELSQVILSSSGFGNASGLILNGKTIALEPFRRPLFSQALYLLVCVVTFCLVLWLHEAKHERALIYGTTIFALYGLFEVALFLATGASSDFVSNRTYGADEDRIGSLFQTYNVAGIQMQRLKSLAGEPSMYVFTTLPVLVLAISQRMLFAAVVIGLSIVFTMSSTAVIGLATAVATYSVLRRSIVPLLVSILVGAVVTTLFFPIIQALIIETLAKAAQETFSGEDRFGSFLAHLSYWLAAPSEVELFGIGFGNVRSPDFFSTLLVNTGALGFLAFAALFAVPLLKLDRSLRSATLKTMLVMIYVMLMVSVAEYSYLITWITLALSYAELQHQRRARIVDRQESAAVGNV